MAYEDEAGVVLRVGPGPEALVPAAIDGAGGRAPALLYAGDGHLHALWGGPNAQGLIHAERSPAGWSVDVVSETPLAGRANALAQDPAGALSGWTLVDALTATPRGPQLTTQLLRVPLALTPGRERGRRALFGWCGHAAPQSRANRVQARPSMWGLSCTACLERCRTDHRTLPEVVYCSSGHCNIRYIYQDC